MRTRLDSLVTAVHARGGAVPAFTCYDFTTALALVSAAEDCGEGIILLVAPKTASAPFGARLLSALRQLADRAAVPVCVQLDHAHDLDAIVAGVEAGADCVLADGSSRDFDANVRFVATVRAAIADPGVVIEAELGGLAGDEDRAFAVEAGDTTSPGAVAEFVSRSGAELLAVAVGNVHGRYSGEPRIRWDVLRDIAAVSTVPLVLHGASGLGAEDLTQAVGLGIGKININTELRTGILRTLEDSIAPLRADGENLAGLIESWSRTTEEFARATLGTLAGREA